MKNDQNKWSASSYLRLLIQNVIQHPGMQSGVERECSFYGSSLAEGICCGKAFIYRHEDEQTPVRQVAPKELSQEVTKFEMARVATRAEILGIQRKIASAVGARDAGIFEAHLLVVEDHTLIDEVLKTLERELKNVEHVFDQVVERYCKTLRDTGDPYLRERVLDIEDVRRRMLRHMLGRFHPAKLDEISKGSSVVLARSLSPSDAAFLYTYAILGCVTEIGSRNSHTAIIIRSLNIPSIFGVADICGKVRTGDEVLLDGYRGILIHNPAAGTLDYYGELANQEGAVAERLEAIRNTLSITRDGFHIILSANIGLLAEVEDVHKNGAEGIGLYRTEFLFLNRSIPPSEEEQYENYRLVAQRTKPYGVIIRTVDAGSDKIIKSLHMEKEQNPSLGCRAIRFCLQHPIFFKKQLRALLRAAVETNIRLLYPMISGITELRRANALLKESQTELQEEGIPFQENLEVGIMIEVPSAALTAHILAEEVDFFSIGTNDLTQYAVAVDRVNEQIAHLYDPMHPALIRLIKMVVEAAHTQGIWIGLCGEIASDIRLTPLLLGLGLDELSVGASLVPRIKNAVQSLDMEICINLAHASVQAHSSATILEKCLAVARSHYNELLT
ncbi:MAG: phosphoenolpyruvate--protein phosphotransferase [Candidatus Xiphinematobacter sp.]|nr:MAG: phosphoenolpyruvate--protein phosphotransferase [Candidatus Xiphinematobacter sp.]